MALTGMVIDRITRTGDIGEPGYSGYGQTLPYCSKSGSKDDWHGATQDNLLALFYRAGSFYITESVYSYLMDNEIELIRSRLRGVVPNSYVYRYSKFSEFGSGKVFCHAFKKTVQSRPVPAPTPPAPTPPSDPCENVTCGATCAGVDRYTQVCENGICVRGTLLEVNSTKCGYQPPTPTPPTPTPPTPPTPTPPTPTPPAPETEANYTEYAIAIGAMVAAYLILR